MVDLFDDLVKEAQKQKKDFLKTVKVMQDIKKQGLGASFNNKFKIMGDIAKCRFITAPFRDGNIGERPKYVAQVADITDSDAGDMPMPFILTTYHMQQIYGDLMESKILKEPSRDRKLLCSVGTVWNVQANESTFTGAGKKKDFMLNFNILPDECVLNTDALTQELQAEAAAAIPTENGKVNLGMT